MRKAEVAIVGGGIIGASIAYHLAARGVGGIVVFEREEELGTGSTGKCAGGVRLQFSTAANVEMSRVSIAALKRFEDELEQPVADALCHLCLDQPRCDRVHGHAAAGHLGGHGLGHGDQSGLGGGVVGLARVRLLGAHDRCDVDDTAVALADHRPQRAAREPEGGRQVGVDHPVPVVVVDLRGEAVRAHARVVHEHEHGAELLLELLEDRVGGVGIADVRLDGERAAAGVGDLLDDRLGGLGVAAVVHAHRPALRGERLGDRGADAARPAGDESTSIRASIHAPHWITPAPQVKPAPKAASTTFIPGSSNPRSRASASAIGRVADEVLP